MDFKSNSGKCGACGGYNDNVYLCNDCYNEFIELGNNSDIDECYVNYIKEYNLKKIKEIKEKIIEWFGNDKSSV